jgi:undecaprenyl-diphosphatase
LLCWWAVADHFALSRQADEYVSLTVSRWASHNEVINHAVYIASQTDILTGALMVALLYYCWFSNSTAEAQARLLLGFGAVLASGVASRLLQVSLPLRLRPMHAWDSGFHPLPGIDPTLANHWGSFPSDHAALFFALAAVVWRQSRWLGLLAMCSALFGVLPRVYLGLHYLSDVVAGAALGVGLVFMLGRFGPRTLARRGVAWGQRRPGLAYGMAFLMSFEVATLFEDIRQVGRGIPAVLKQFGL